jgi:hypothetical protein
MVNRSRTKRRSGQPDQFNARRQRPQTRTRLSQNDASRSADADVTSRRNGAVCSGHSYEKLEVEFAKMQNQSELYRSLKLMRWWEVA